jgi:acetyltransferase-like isoleucine patch superfamily enzyme
VSRHLAHDWFDRALPENVEIGERCWIYSAFAFVHYQSHRPCGVKVGHDTGLYTGTFFDLGPNGEVEIGSFCTCVGAIISSDRRVTIGDYVFVAHEVVIADRPVETPIHEDIREGPESRLVRAPIAIADDAWIGARAILLGGASIGQGAIVGAGAVVDSAVPPYSIVAGNPARVVGKVSSPSRPARL